MTRARHLRLRRLAGAGFLLAALLPCAARDASAQQAGGSTIEATLLAPDERIDLDGRIEESVWSRVEAISDFRQREPIEGGPPSHPTEVRIAYDRDNLYIAAILFDEPDEILARQRARDAFLFTDDRFAWVLDTFRDGRTGYHFETNAAGALSDGLITGTGGGGPGGGGFGGVNRSWDGIWEVRTARRPDGWSAEIRIPFRTLNFVPDGGSWGINFLRSIRRNNEEILWRGYGRNEGLNRLVFAGELAGLDGVSQGIGLEAVASGIGSWRNTPGDADPTTFPRDMSLDLNYSVTPSLRASFSVNTDFAEVESDQRRVNLTRFPLRFPERRDFFLEGSSVFTFAPRSGPQPFFSRRIGIESGQQVPIDYGVRLTGQLNGVDLGFYQMGTGAHSFVETGVPADPADPPPEDHVRFENEAFTVARARVPIFEQSAIGAIYTRRTTGVDAGRLRARRPAYARRGPSTIGPAACSGTRISRPRRSWSGTRIPIRPCRGRSRTSPPGGPGSTSPTTSGRGTSPTGNSATTTVRRSGSWPGTISAAWSRGSGGPHVPPSTGSGRWRSRSS